MSILYMLGILVCAIVVCSFAVWAIRKFVPPEMQKWVFLLAGLIGVILFCIIVMNLVGGGTVSLPRIR
jgi:hypothetical protein